MMNDAFQQVIAATDDERRDLFLTTARRLGTAVQNVEKGFWVCWTLDALFNGPSDRQYPRLLFKGGTSLSKSFGLINRFSEDIDITVLRDDLGEPASIADLEGLSGKKRRAKLEAIKAACQAFISGSLLHHFLDLLAQVMEPAGGLRRWHDHRGQLRHGGQRVSRHYYDVFKLLQSPIGEAAQANRQLGVDCARHARMFFNNPDFDLDDAVAGRFSLSPLPSMRELLERDYDATAVMIMGPAPSFAAILASIATCEATVNSLG